MFIRSAEFQLCACWSGRKSDHKILLFLTIQANCRNWQNAQNGNSALRNLNCNFSADFNGGAAQADGPIRSLTRTDNLKMLE